MAGAGGLANSVVGTLVGRVLSKIKKMGDSDRRGSRRWGCINGDKWQFLEGYVGSHGGWER
jgi:hypothetical protein